MAGNLDFIQVEERHGSVLSSQSVNKADSSQQLFNEWILLEGRHLIIPSLPFKKYFDCYLDSAQIRFKSQVQMKGIEGYFFKHL